MYLLQAEIRVAREELSNNKAPGHSRIQKEDFELAKDTLDDLFQEFANKICETGIWPEAMKYQVVCPLPKNSKKRDISHSSKP